MDAAFTEIPDLDLSAWWGDAGDRAAFVDQMRSVCHELGFFHLVGHGITQDFLDEHAAQRERFFALDLEAKQQIDKARSPHFRGWEAVGAELTAGRTDWREQLDLASENPVSPAIDPPYLRLEGPNQWPGEDVLPGFRAHVTEYMRQLSEVGDVLLDVFSVALGLEEPTLRTLFGRRRYSLVKLISYPPSPPGEAGVNGHNDAGFLTLLLQHEVPGLQVLDPDGGWIDVAPRTDAFVVNLGEMLQEMTGNYFVATTHRVITAEARFSSGWFHGPELGTPLERLPLPPACSAAVAASPRHRDAGLMARKEDIDAGRSEIASRTGAGVYGNQLWNYYRRSYPANVARHHADVLVDETLSG